MGPSIKTDADAVIAVTGAPIEVKVNGEVVDQYSRIELVAGDELSFGMLRGGSKFFIAVAGGIDVPEALGSRSTYPVGKIGGFEGRCRQAGDVLPVGPAAHGTLPQLDSIPEDLRPSYAREMQVRVMVGLYDHKLTDEGLKNFTDAEWTITPVADRMRCV